MSEDGLTLIERVVLLEEKMANFDKLEARIAELERENAKKPSGN